MPPLHDFFSMWRAHGHCDCIGWLQQHLSLASNDWFPPEANICAQHWTPKHTGNLNRHEALYDLQDVFLHIICFYYRSASFSMVLFRGLNSSWTSLKLEIRWLWQHPKLHRCMVHQPIPSMRSNLPGWCCSNTKLYICQCKCVFNCVCYIAYDY